MAIKLMAAHRLRFWMIGNRYGHATLRNVIVPRAVVVTAIMRTQFIGRVIAG